MSAKPKILNITAIFIIGLLALFVIEYFRYDLPYFSSIGQDAITTVGFLLKFTVAVIIYFISIQLDTKSPKFSFQSSVFLIASAIATSIGFVVMFRLWFKGQQNFYAGHSYSSEIVVDIII